MERIDSGTWRTDDGDEIRAQGLKVTVEFGEKTKAEVLGAVEAVKAENAKLREQLDWERSENGWMREFNDRMAEHCGTKDCPSLVAYVNKIETENTKLRELAADMLRAMRRMEASAGMDALVGHSAWFAPKLHELGIEVDA
jgi:hypothetical protein